MRLRFPSDRHAFAAGRQSGAVAVDVPITRTRDGYRVAARSEVPSGLRLQGSEPLLIERGTRVMGGVFAGGTVRTQPEVTIHGPVRAWGDVVIGAHARVGGDLQARGDVRLLPEALVVGDVDAKGEVHLFAGAEVRGTVRAGGDIVVWGGARTESLRPGGRLRTEAFPAPTPA